MPEKCYIINCPKPAVAHGLCDTHRKRVARHGDVNATRPVDWGSREKHPAYNAWCNLRRYRHELPAAWASDFWAFVKAVPEKPKGRATATRPDPDKPWGPDNFYWRETQASSDHRASKAEYMRERSRRVRAADPAYHRRFHLRRYGITPEWYDAKLEEQGGVCAICSKPETAVIKGRTLALAVDHCHDSGAVRGLLCRACNSAIGMFNHDVALLSNAISYLGS